MPRVSPGSQIACHFSKVNTHETKVSKANALEFKEPSLNSRGEPEILLTRAQALLHSRPVGETAEESLGAATAE